jgi:dTDP-4-amino-4,6-dideoxygalactose transaminase
MNGRAFRGGAIVVNNEQFFDPTKLATDRKFKTELAMPAQELIFALSYNIATAPWFYGRFILPRILRGYANVDMNDHPPIAPDVSDKVAETSTPSYARDFHPYQALLALRMLRRMDWIRGQIARLVSIYLDAFRNRSIMTFVPPECDHAGLLRFPIAFAERERAQVLRVALSQGLYPETNFEQPLPEESEYSRFPNTVWAARNLMQLPLYTALSPRSAERLAQKVAEIATHVPGQSSAR